LKEIEVPTLDTHISHVYIYIIGVYLQGVHTYVNGENTNKKYVFIYFTVWQ